MVRGGQGSRGGSKYEQYFHLNNERKEAVCKLCDKVLHIKSKRNHLKHKHSISPDSLENLKSFKYEDLLSKDPEVDPLLASVMEKSGETSTVETAENIKTTKNDQQLTGYVSIIGSVSDLGPSCEEGRKVILESRDQVASAFQTGNWCSKDADFNIIKLKNKSLADSIKKSKLSNIKPLNSKSEKRIIEMAEKEAMAQKILQRKQMKERLSSNCSEKGFDPKQFGCPKCKFRCNSKTHLQVHLQVAHDQQWKCDQCLSTFCTQHEILAHMTLSHAGYHDGQSIVACPKCHIQCTSDKQLHAHLKWIHDQHVECDECSATFDEQRQLSAHKTLTHGLDGDEGIANNTSYSVKAKASSKDIDDLWVNCCLCQKSMRTLFKTTDSIISRMKTNRKVKIQYKCIACTLTHGLDGDEDPLHEQDDIGTANNTSYSAKAKASSKYLDDLWVNCCLCQKSMRTSFKTTDSVISKLKTNRKVKFQYKCNTCNESSDPPETILIQ